MERYYTVREISDVLQVHQRTIIKWIRSGQLIAVKLAGRRLWRIRERDLGGFLKSK